MKGLIDLQLKVTVHDILKDRLGLTGSGQFLQELPGGATVKELLFSLQLQDSLVGLVIVNGRQACPGKILEDGDMIKIFSPLAGG